ncbi:MAG: DUF1566 domain-containing protein [Pseudomonadota bacterium]
MKLTSRGWASVVLPCLLTIASGWVMAQCADGNLNPAIESSAALSEFNDNGDGTLAHRRTRLVWQRCALGQIWDGAGCAGLPSQLDWTAALLAAESHSQAGRDDWRLPNRNELASIIEGRCFSPALDSDAFPNATLTAYWSSTPVSGGGEQVWVVELLDGGVIPLATDTLQSVRLVRGGE